MELAASSEHRGGLPQVVREVADTRREDARLARTSAQLALTSEANAERTVALSMMPSIRRAKKLPGKTRQRTRYTLTAKGKQGLVAWIATPAQAAIRLLAGGMIDDAAMWRASGDDGTAFLAAKVDFVGAPVGRHLAAHLEERLRAPAAMRVVEVKELHRREFAPAREPPTAAPAPAR